MRKNVDQQVDCTKAEPDFLHPIYTKPIVVEFYYMQNTKMSRKEFIFDSFYIYLHEPSFNIFTSYYIKTVRNVWLLNFFSDLQLFMLKILQLVFQYRNKIEIISNEKKAF